MSDGRAHLHDLAVVHDAEPLAEGHGLLLVVRDDDEGHTEALLDVEQLELGVLAQLLVERRERLIEQQQLGALDQRARQRHALALPAGQLVRLARPVAAHLHDVEDLAHLAADGVAPEPLLLETEGHVLLHAHVREQRVGLEHHVDRTLVRRDCAHVHAVDIDAARTRALEARQHPQQRGLARSRAAEQAEDLAAPDVERHLVHGREVAELLGDAGPGARRRPDRDSRRGWRRSSGWQSL